MEDDDKIKEFPDVSVKLAAPKKLSTFEKERQAAEAKRQRADAENAAALREFEDSFGYEDDYDDSISLPTNRNAPPKGPRGASSGYAPGRYGAPPSGPRSGPGSLGPGPGSGPPPSLKRKRQLEEARERLEAQRETSLVTDKSDGPAPVQELEAREDDLPKPTLQLTSLPWYFVDVFVKALLRPHVKVHSVQFTPPIVDPTNPRKHKQTRSAIVTLTTETTAAQIESAISAVKDTYVGCGFYISISRHLSSTALHPRAVSTTARSTEPFGAQIHREPEVRPSLRHAPPPASFDRGYPPPNQYDRRSQPYNRPQRQILPASVHVRAPMDVNTMRAIHIVADALLSEENPNDILRLEDKIMEKVFRDERFAFLFDTQSPAGIYYRYLLWNPMDAEDRLRDQKYGVQGLDRVHWDLMIDWTPPNGQVPFPNLASLAHVVDDLDYHSSEEESDNDDGERPTGLEEETTRGSNESRRFSPLKRARLVHLLARLPTTITKLRKGDLARITNFVINHAGQGAEEIVDILLLNIFKPLSLSLASKYEDTNSSSPPEDDEDEETYEPEDTLPTFTMPPTSTDLTAPSLPTNQEDPSNAKLIALYTISDILSASSTAGARNAWKYRTLFEIGFRTCHVFEHLGRLDKDLAWGKLKSDQWKRKVGVVFGIWEGWSVFGAGAQEEFKKSFAEPPLTADEKAGEEMKEKKREGEKLKARFKKVEGKVELQEMEGVDGVPMVEEDVDGVPMAEEDVDGIPMVEEEEVKPTVAPTVAKSVPAVAFKRRMRAEDMFASDEE